MAVILPHFELLSLQYCIFRYFTLFRKWLLWLQWNHGYYCLMQNVLFVNSKWCAILWTCHSSSLAFCGISSGLTNSCHGNHCYYGYHVGPKCTICRYALLYQVWCLWHAKFLCNHHLNFSSSVPSSYSGDPEITLFWAYLNTNDENLCPSKSAKCSNLKLQ